MKTFKTNLEIEFEVDVIEYGHRTVEVLAICTEDSQSFDLQVEIDSTIRTMLESGDYSWIKEEMLTEAMQWVNETVIGHLASEIAKICLRKSSKSVYCTYTFGTLSVPNLTIASMDRDNCTGKIGSLLESHYAYGENGIRKLLNELNK